MCAGADQCEPALARAILPHAAGADPRNVAVPAAWDRSIVAVDGRWQPPAAQVVAELFVAVLLLPLSQLTATPPPPGNACRV